MAEAKKEEKSYLREVARFYFSPQLRTLGTLIYFGVFGYFTLYYIDNIFLVARFLLYVIIGHTALSGASFLIAGVIFMASLIAPFFVSFYSIFVLQKIWDKTGWSSHVKWIMTAIITVLATATIMTSDNISRWIAAKPSMQSFIEDSNLTNKI